jgi:AcrR family transcriptional regulator
MIEVAATELFVERGYRGASIEEIARRSGVTPPVLYDHFSSKLDLYGQLLESHFAQLREIWARKWPGDDPPPVRTARSIDAWFSYVERTGVAKLLFREPSGDRKAEAVHAEVAARSRAKIMERFVAEPGAEEVTGSLTDEGVEMAWVVLRGVLQGLALWWADHPDVPRERVVAMAMNSLWIGFERAAAGEGWRPVQFDQPG